MRAKCLSSLTRSAAMLPVLLQVALGLAPVRAAEGEHVESSRHGDVVAIRAAADLARAVSGSLRSIESRYTLAVREQGSRLLYAGRVRLGFPLLGSLGQSVIEDNVGRRFGALVDEIERQYRGEPAPSKEAPR